MSQVSNIKIQSEKFGLLLNQTFTDAVQFKLFLKVIQASIELKTNFTHFDGTSTLIHIPYNYLIESVITTHVQDWTAVDQIKTKTKNKQYDNI